MGEIAKPERATYFIARNSEGTIVHYGKTLPNQVTTTGQPILEFTTEEPEYLQLAAPYADKFPELPEEGRLEAGSMYRFGETVVIVRQTHYRTQFDPSETPALFMTANTTQEWIENESVFVGTRRRYEGVWYEALQAHVTEFTPDLTPALWRVVNVGPGIPRWSNLGGSGPAGSYMLDDEVIHDNPNDSGNDWVYESTFNGNTTEPGRDGTFDRFWRPVRAV